MKEYFDKHPESIPYLERLEREWLQHGKIIIACDFDDTISPWSLNDETFCKKVISILRIAKEVGAYLVIETACDVGRYHEIRGYCSRNGIEIDEINATPIDLPYGKTGIYANIFINDRAGINEALTILEFAMYKVRGRLHGPNSSLNW
jgi:hypothetical protein